MVALQAAETKIPPPPAETLVERDARTAWWREARYGMFVHWDMSSVAGTEISWSRRGSMPLDNGNAPAGYVADPAYDTLYRRFNPKQFNAMEWARLAKSVGMRYIVFTAKHHGGFCMWDTKLTDYSIMQTPFKRDIVKELAEACHAEGLRFGVYYSQRDWHHPDYGMGDNRKYMDYMNRQLRELLTGYGKVDVLWFDSYGRGDPLTFWRIPETWALIKSLQPQVVINDRLRALKAPVPKEFSGDFDTPKQKLGGYKDRRLWESCMTLVDAPRGGWSYRKDGVAKPSSECIEMLVSCATGDGNLLLGVGPDALGVIPEDQVKPLRELGQWLEKNGRSIYGTRGGPYKPGSFGGSTRRGNSVFIHVRKWPEGALKLPPLPATIQSAQVLDGGEATFQQTKDSLELTVPESARHGVVTVVELQLDRDAMAIPVMQIPSPVTPIGNDGK
jgi:alpha-L-fucosidase